jgi:hypothetical protein
MDEVIRTALSPSREFSVQEPSEPPAPAAPVVSPLDHGSVRQLPALEPRERELRRRRQLIITWCDRHLAAIHALASLMTDQSTIVVEGMAEVLAAPDETCIASIRPWHKERDHGLSSKQCPADAAPLDRLELALYLLGDRTCVAAARALGLPEHLVNARLLGELGVLLAPCDSLATIPALG